MRHYFFRLGVYIVASSAVLLIMASTVSAAPRLGLMETGGTEPTESAEEWNAIQKSGAELFRTRLTTGGSANGNDWSYYDRVFGQAAERGVTILPVLGGRLDGGLGVPTEKVAWSDWVKKAVRRYGYNGTFWSANPGIPARPVIAWELLNEPNNPEQQGGIAISPWEYGTFLAWAGPAIQAASESWGGQKTGVLFAGLIGDAEYQWYFQTAYLQSGASSAFTGFSFHPYALNPPDGNRFAATKSKIKGARNFLNGLGAGGKSLWITEFGWPVRADFAVSEETQADLLNQSVDWMQAEATWLNLHSIIWYNYRDSDFKTTWAYFCGLRDEVGNFRKSWFAFQAQAGKPRWPVPTIAFQANTGNLWTYTKAGWGSSTPYGMAAGTSPSIGQYKGRPKVAFQANSGVLWTYEPGGAVTNTGLGMAPGTSPSITALEDGVVAFQASGGNLWTYQAGGAITNTGYGMASGTSPSITTLPALTNRAPTRYPVAFHGSNGSLWFYEAGGAVVNTGLGMASGTSPSIAALDGPGPTFAIAFQANTGSLWFYEPGGAIVNTGLGMKAGTSPSITALPGGKFAIAFQVNTGALWTYEPGGAITNTGLGLQSPTSPSISALSDAPYYRAFEVAFHAGGGSLWTFEPGGAITNTILGNQPGTSPSIAPG